MYGPQPPHDPLGEEVALAFVNTTNEQRRNVADDYLSGSRMDLCNRYADLLKISRDGLLVCAMLEIEHPCICDERGRPKSRHYGVLLKLIRDFQPVDN